MYGVSQPYYYNGSMYNYPPMGYTYSNRGAVENGDAKGYESLLMARYISEFSFDILYEYVPSISEVFVQRLLNVLDATRLSKPSVLLGMTYLYRKKKMATITRCGKLQYGLEDEGTIFLYIILSLIIANKYNDDNTFTNRSWSNATGISIQELNRHEKDWLISCNYDLHFNQACSTMAPPAPFSNQYETRPWLVSLAHYDRFFNPHIYFAKDDIYGQNDPAKKALGNGLQDFSGIESMYNHYESHRSLRSPARSNFVQVSPSTPQYFNDYSSYNPYYNNPFYSDRPSFNYQENPSFNGLPTPKSPHVPKPSQYYSNNQFPPTFSSSPSYNPSNYSYHYNKPQISLPPPPIPVSNLYNPTQLPSLSQHPSYFYSNKDCNFLKPSVFANQKEDSHDYFSRYQDQRTTPARYTNKSFQFYV